MDLGYASTGSRSFIENGGRLINLSGNTMWWQVRFEDNGRTMVAYKNHVLDPVKDQTLTTDLNWDYPILDTEYSIIGVHYKNGGATSRGVSLIMKTGMGDLGYKSRSTGSLKVQI